MYFSVLVVNGLFLGGKWDRKVIDIQVLICKKTVSIETVFLLKLVAL